MKTTKIMIIENEMHMALPIAKRLHSLGYETILCASENEKLERIRSTRPNLIILDIQLPEFTGIKIFKALKNSVWRHIPVIFLSDDPNYREWCLDLLKAEGFVTKPYDPADLLEAIEEITLNLSPPAWPVFPPAEFPKRFWQLSTY